MDPTARSFGRGMLQSCLIQLGAMALVGGSVVVALLLAAVLPLPARSDRALLVGLMLGLAFSFSIVVAVAVGVGVIWRRKVHLDAAFQPLGLQGSAYLQGGRQYHGQVWGRPVDVYFYKGPRLDIEVPTPLATRLSVGSKTGLGSVLRSALDLRVIETGDPWFQQLFVRGHDEPWTRWVLQQQAVRTPILQLATSQSGREIRAFMVAPGRVMFSLIYAPWDAITQSTMTATMQQLLQVVQALESVQPAREQLQPSGLERTARSMRGFGAGLTLVMLAIVAVPMLLTGIACLVGVVLMIAGVFG